MWNVSATAVAARVEVLSMAMQEALRVLSAPQAAAFAVALRGRLQVAREGGAVIEAGEEADAAAAGELQKLLGSVESIASA